VKQPSITSDRSRTDDLQLKVLLIDKRNGGLGLGPVVRKIRDLTMFDSSHEREQTIPSSLPFSGNDCNHKQVIE